MFPTASVFLVKIEDILSYLYGFFIILLPKKNKAGIIYYSKKTFRQVGEPQSEVVIRGPREGFVEVIRTNVAMIRSRLPSTNMTQVRFNVY
ncbi:spore germination protein [Neobacillus drentensis]|uniref:spore germination protein n=1 Tax=Neobacillus drentensis TaxID=220684 RepID=UPI003B58A1DC